MIPYTSRKRLAFSSQNVFCVAWTTIAASQRDCPASAAEPISFSALAGNSTCGPGEYTCLDGRCLPERWRCDGDPDCKEGEDEDPITCGEEMTLASPSRRALNRFSTRSQSNVRAGGMALPLAGLYGRGRRVLLPVHSHGVGVRRAQRLRGRQRRRSLQ